MSWPAADTPFFTTDQNGSLAWPWLTTMMRVFCWARAGAPAAMVRAAAAARPMTNDFICYPPKGVLVRTPQPDSGRRERYGITYRAVELAEETPTARMKIIGPLASPRWF